MQVSEAQEKCSVSLQQYAAVKAALAEAFSLSEVLTAERISEAEWTEAIASWADRIVSDPEVFSAYGRELARAEDWLTRKVNPLDGDVGAWVAFLAATSADAPDETLRKTGLRASDLSRLVRRWKQRVEKDPTLAKQMRDLRSKIDKGAKAELPSISVEPSRLKRSRGTSEEPPQTTAADVASPSGEHSFGLERYAALAAELNARPGQLDEVLAKFGISSDDFEEVERIWTARFVADKQARLDFGRLFSHQRARLAASQSQRGAEEAPVPTSAPPSASASSPEWSVVPEATAPVALNAGSRRFDVTLGVAAPQKAALPFQPADPPVSAPPARSGERGRTTTSEEDPGSRRPPLPFSSGSAPEALKRPHAASEPRARGSTQTVDLKKDRPPTLPFTPKNEGVSDLKPPTRKGAQGTAAFSRKPRNPTLPFQVPTKGTRSAQTRSGAPPNAAAKGGVTMTIEQYASLCTELGLYSNRAGEVLKRYGLTHATKSELDERFKAFFASDQSAHARWYRASETYLAWLLKGGTPK